MRIKQAERKLNCFDPPPDLGNANEGNIRIIGTGVPIFSGSPFFYTCKKHRR